ncbi:hypothetical protein [Mucilaginibacter sp.]|uniref:WD40/YVTN/BNR-like repeat-containing protein n=1 Tax=Mucilaginibacter sp. TaxID=1882438 RepID=UPI0026028B6A|nr:hypothetical protein [Mucilaginibacter sp.]
MKLYLPALILLVSIIAGCSKSKIPGPITTGDDNKVKFEIAGGNNQEDTIGRILSDTIKLKATKNGIALNTYFIEFRGSGCNDDLPIQGYMNSDGICRYMYRLAGNTGAQTLKATLLDPDKKRIDSLVLNFTGVAPAQGWHPVACVPFVSAMKFCRLSSGRLFASFTEGQYLRYSDDNGISWNAAKSLGNKHNIVSIKSDSKTQLVAAALNEGIYYSGDAGDTWKFIGSPLASFESFVDMNYTPGGKLFYTANTGTIYLSENNGTTWSKLRLGEPIAPLTDPCEANNGDFWINADALGAFKSTDKGATWTRQYDTDSHYGEVIQSLYIDNTTGWIYKGRNDNNNGVFFSKNNGTSFNHLFITNNLPIKNIEVVNGVVYFSDGYQLYTINGVNSFIKLFSSNGSTSSDYIVANNGNIVAGNNNYLYFFKK